jgi:hypothetical protein
MGCAINSSVICMEYAVEVWGKVDGSLDETSAHFSWLGRQ